MEELASAASSWVTFDNSIGKWSVVINKTGTSNFSFNDDNIVGGINITETAFDEMYNSVEVQFPHRDLLNQRDWVRVTIPLANRLPNEPDNLLTIQTNVINDPVQAEQIALTELKQSRVNKIVEFSSDFSSLGVTAGDIVDITNTEYDWAAKLYRIVSVSEEDDDEGNIVLRYTCLEYDQDVYNYGDITRFERSRATGILPKLINTDIDTSDDVATGVDLGRLLLLTGLSSLFNLDNVVDLLTGENDVELKSGQCLQPNFNGAGSESVCSEIATPVSLSAVPKTIAGCEIPSNPEYAITNYVISGVNSGDINIPLSGSTSGNLGSITGAQSAGGKTASIAFRDAAGNTVATKPISFASGFTVNTTQTQSGSTRTFNIASNAPGGTTLSWAVTGTNLAAIYTGATSGTVVTDSSGNASQSFTLTANNTTESASFNFNVASGNCSGPGNTSTVSVPNGVAPPAAVCGFSSIPFIYCGIYDASDNLVGIQVQQNINVRTVASGGTVVPASVSVSGGSIVVDSTVRVDTTSGQAGTDVNVITSFNSANSSSPITGTTTTIRGWFS
jgi:hypothetical protein